MVTGAPRLSPPLYEGEDVALEGGEVIELAMRSSHSRHWQAFSQANR